MKHLRYISIFAILSCNNPSKQTAEAPAVDFVPQEKTIQKIDTTTSKGDQDTLLILTGISDTLRFDKSEIKIIIHNHPEFFADLPSNPDQAYHCSGDSDFDSEVGQDEYYLLYAYFLMQKNGIHKYEKQRKQLTDIYHRINSLFQSIEYGGTYFGHQYARIAGYVEYSIYVYAQSHGDFEKKYSITKQKQLYIKTLRQLINDEVHFDSNTIEPQKEGRLAELNKYVDELDKLITDHFSLRRAQEFHYANYEY